MIRKLIVAIAASAALTCHAGPPSDASIEELMELVNIEKTLEAGRATAEQLFAQSMREMLQGKQLSAEQQQVMAGFSRRYKAFLREEMSVAKFKPGYIEIFRGVFEQEEVDGLIAFYKSPAGKAMIAKMPLVMARTMLMVQDRMAVWKPRIEAMMREAMAEARIPL